MAHWFTADTHFGHRQMIEYCLRQPGLSDEQVKQVKAGERVEITDEMVNRQDLFMIQQINESVKPDDTLWIIGDFAHDNCQYPGYYRQQILCQTVNLIKGNHDPDLIYSANFFFIADRFLLQITQGNDKPIELLLDHYPGLSWLNSHKGSIQLHGHTHHDCLEQIQLGLRSYHVGVDTNLFRPWSVKQILERDLPFHDIFQKRLERVGKKENGGMKKQISWTI
jgi:calcineurin-like phosphoesterase family protein